MSALHRLRGAGSSLMRLAFALFLLFVGNRSGYGLDVFFRDIEVIFGAQSQAVASIDVLSDSGESISSIELGIQVAPDNGTGIEIAGASPGSAWEMPPSNMSVTFEGDGVNDEAIVQANVGPNANILPGEVFQIEFDLEGVAPGVYDVTFLPDFSRVTNRGIPVGLALNPGTITILDVSFVDGDLNQDGLVDALDAAILFAAWDTADAVADINGDGVVDAADAGVVFSEWTGDAAVQVVPEPAALWLLALFSPLLIANRQRRMTRRS